MMMNEQGLQTAGAKTSELTEALRNAIALWAAATSASESLRYKDLLRVKSRNLQDFFLSTAKAVHEVTPLEVRAWREAMEARGLRLATIYARLSFLSSFYSWAMADPVLGQHIQSNPVRLARPKAPKAYQTESAKALSDAQLEQLQRVIQARAAGGDVAAQRDYALFLLFILSGMRRTEVLSLRGQDLEFRADGIVITCRVKGGDYLGRQINNPVVRTALEAYLTTSGRLRILETGGPLWVRHDQGREAVASEQPLTAWAFVRRMKDYAKEAGLEHFHLHQTRHTFARIVAEASGSIIETQDALGHKNPATTRVYVQRIAVKRDKFGDEIAKRLKL